jgi:hypothetical protein
VLWRINYGVIDVYAYIVKLLNESGINFKDYDKDEILNICSNYKGKINKLNYILALRAINGLYNNDRQ